MNEPLLFAWFEGDQSWGKNSYQARLARKHRVEVDGIRRLDRRGNGYWFPKLSLPTRLKTRSCGRVDNEIVGNGHGTQFTSWTPYDLCTHIQPTACSGRGWE